MSRATAISQTGPLSPRPVPVEASACGCYLTCLSVSVTHSLTAPANKGCGVWMMSSSLPHITSNHISYNGLYGVEVFSQKDGSREFPGGHRAQENFNEDGDAILWETELEKDDDPLRQPVTVALVESNSINHNGGECPAQDPSLALHILRE